jgi:tetratricopeptide (TPR) repeat protein
VDRRISQVAKNIKRGVAGIISKRQALAAPGLRDAHRLKIEAEIEKFQGDVERMCAELRDELMPMGSMWDALKLFVPFNCVAKFEKDWDKQDSTNMLNIVAGVTAPDQCVKEAADAVRTYRNVWAHQKPVPAIVLANAVAQTQALLGALGVDKAEWRGLLDACGDPATFLARYEGGRDGGEETKAGGGGFSRAKMRAMLLEEALRAAPIWSDRIPGRNWLYTGNDAVIERMQSGFGGAVGGGGEGQKGIDGGVVDGDGGESTGSDAVDASVGGAHPSGVQLVTQSVNGAGGLGKTHTVIECLHRSRDMFELGVFWVTADTTALLEDSFRHLAVVDMGFDHLAEEKDIAAVRLQVFKVLRQRGGWLLVYDNADNPEVLKGWLPPDNARGCVIVTSRASGESFRRAGVDGVGVMIELDSLEQEASELLMWRHYADKRGDGGNDGSGAGSGGGGVRSVNAAETSSVRDLRVGINGLGEAERAALAWLASGEGLGGLPLALEQVGAYVGMQGITFEAYIQLFHGASSGVFEEADTSLLSVLEEFGLVEFNDELTELGVDSVETLLAVEKEHLVELGTMKIMQRAVLMKRLDAARDGVGRTQRGRQQKKTVRTVWSANLESLRASAPAALELLQLVSVVHPERIPREFAGMAATNLENQEESGDGICCLRREFQDRVTDGVATCPGGHGLNEFVTPDECYGCDGCSERVPTGTQMWGCRECGYDTCTECYSKPSFHSPHGEVLTGELLQSLARYSLVRVYGNGGGGGGGSGGGNDENGAATFTVHRLLQQVIRDDLGNRRGEVVKVAVRVCTAGIRGDWDVEWSEAKDKWYRWQAHGRAVRDVMMDGELVEERGKLAHVVGRGAYELNMLEVCEAMWVEALAMRRRVLPEDHPEIATSLNDLANLYDGQRRYKEAEPMYVEVLAMKRRALPEDHPDIATSLNNLAGLYKVQGRYEEAEAMYVEALAMSRRALPEGHPDIATSLNNLAGLYKVQGRHEEAEAMYVEALAMRRQVLPEGHPDIATSLNNLALLSETQRRYEEAEPMYVEALAMKRRALPEDHPSIAISLWNLAMLYKKKEQYEKALPMVEEAHAILLAAHGPEHEHTRMTANMIEELRQLTGKKAGFGAKNAAGEGVCGEDGYSRPGSRVDREDGEEEEEGRGGGGGGGATPARGRREGGRGGV